MTENFPIGKIDIMPEIQDICKHQEKNLQKNATNEYYSKSAEN